MNDTAYKNAVGHALNGFGSGDLAENARNLLNTLGYQSERAIDLEPNTAAGFIELFGQFGEMNQERAQLEEWESIDFLCQLTGEDITQSAQGTLRFGSSEVDKELYQSYLFFALKLRSRDYTRTQLSGVTREINKLTPMPAMVIFQHGRTLTLSIIDRRPHKRDENSDVLEKITLIKDIDFSSPHRAHIDILSDLSLKELYRQHEFTNFLELHQVWQKTLDTSELNKRFYKELFAWFEWAVAVAEFPKKEKRTLQPEEHVIRLITRLLFIWFIKEKGLVTADLFNETKIGNLLKNYDRDKGDTYYRAVLQNLFFATLNTEIEKRRFSKGTNADHRNFSRYRYKDQIAAPDKLLKLFEQTPFINGGLFDCLDSEKATGTGGYRIDCFSDGGNKELSVPNRLFFDEARGLFPLLTHYKFTVEENTPIEQEVALDPELLGKVFENLLAAYNPETGATARKQTGSYYTPRPIVDYMVDEVLVAALTRQGPPTDGDAKFWEERLRYLLDYAQAFDDANELFEADEAERVVRAISELKVLDPAVGSGAFPMGVLHKLTLALRRIDPENEIWEKLQKERALQRAEAAFETKDDQVRREELLEINETFKRYRDSDFGRKLYLIQNSIFGLDIQSIACQIAKLRFFISLAIEQEPDRNADNFGIKPLPNLETRFIAANTLIGLEGERTLTSPKAEVLERELGENRERHFHATTRPQKLACKRADKKLRRELATELRHIGMPADNADKVANWDPYDQNASADWFDSEWMFGVREGFDVVIGNPPYNAKINQDDLNKIKANAQNTKNSNSAALFIDYAKNRLIQGNRQGGIVAFIVPKSLLYSEKWHELAFSLLEKTATLVDVEKAFKKVKLEQVVFIYSPQCDNCFYVGRKFLNNAFVRTTHIDRKYPKQFQAWICDVSSDDIKLGSKIANTGTYCRDISKTTRGLPIQKNLSTHGDIEVIGGKEVSRYGIVGIKGFVNRENLDFTSQKIQRLLQPKVISQRLVAHIQNPKPHIKITSTVDKTGDILNVDTVENTIIENKNFSPIFISSLFNSTLINWYAYRFIFCSAIRTMDFDNYYVGKVPVPIATFEQQVPIIELVDQILDAKRTNPDTDVSELEKKIDQIVYLLYNLTPEEIAIVEGAANV